MQTNAVIETMMGHRSIRKYTDEAIDSDILNTIIRAGQQAAFAYQVYSVIISRQKDKNPFKAPVLLTICVDLYKFERIMEKRGWKMATNDLTALMFGIEDASYMAQNMVVAAESFGLGTCYLGHPIMSADKLAKTYELPNRVYPIVQITMGFPAENPTPRPRYPINFAVFEEKYPVLTETDISDAIKVMDEGYLAQDYYKKNSIMIDPSSVKEEDHTFDNYSWTEHISRKLGLWMDSVDEQKEILEKRGFKV